MTSTTPHPPPARPSVVFLHAHPDDESIFTGGTIAKLTAAGVRVTLIIATDDLTGGGEQAIGRRLEAEQAAAILKVDRVEFLGHPDSGLGPTPATGSFATLPVGEPAARVAAIAREVGADALIVYEPGGIYGHPDHLAVHRVGVAAARLAAIATVYESTVDREHLHFVATHLVGGAVEALMQVSADDAPADGKLVGGTPTVLIDTTVDVTDVLDRKRAAMAAHTSQIPPDSEVLELAADTFAAVYGHEWYVRRGPRSILDAMFSG